MTPKRSKSNKSPGSIKSKDKSPGADESPKEDQSPGSSKCPKGSKSLCSSSSKSPKENKSPGSNKSPKGNKSPGSNKSPKESKSPDFSKSPKGNKSPGSNKSPKSNLENYPPEPVKHKQFSTQDDNFNENTKAVRSKIPFDIDPLNLEVSNITQSEASLTKSRFLKSPFDSDKSPGKRFSESTLDTPEKKVKVLNDQESSQLMESFESHLPLDSSNSPYQKQPSDSIMTKVPSRITSRSRSCFASISFASQIHNQNFVSLPETSKDLPKLEIPEFLNKLKSLKLSEFQKEEEVDNFPEEEIVKELSKRIPENFLKADFPSSEDHSKSIKSKLLFIPHDKVTEDCQARVAKATHPTSATEAAHQTSTAADAQKVSATKVPLEARVTEESHQARVLEITHQATSVNVSFEDMEKDVSLEKMEE